MFKPRNASMPTIALLAATLAAPLAAHAQSAADKWEWQAAIYGYFPALKGTTQFPSGRAGPDIDVSADTLIDGLKMAAMGTFSGKKGKWGFWTDLFYTDVGGSKTGTREFNIHGFPLPADVTGDLDLDVKTTLWTLAVTFELAKAPTYSLDLVAGTRLADMDQHLSWNFHGDISGIPLPGRSGASDVSATNWDGIIGVKGMAWIGGDRKWFLPYYVDVGTGQSQLTWQFMAGIGYEFGWGSLVASWRYIDYEMKSDAKLQSVEFNGPMIGAVFRF